jgi:hypothetical protein
LKKVEPTGIKITKVSGFLQELEGLKDGPGAFYRGQPVDKPLLPAVARKWNQKDLTKSEEAYLNEFRRRASAFCDVSRHDDWQLLALAQHNGAPTRLLDWSRNPLAALWFAVSTMPEKGGSAVVWRVVPEGGDYLSKEDYKKSPFSIGRTKWFEPAHVSPRILAQEGYFSVHKYWKSGNDGMYVPLENQREFKKKLTKFYVFPGREDEILVQLDHLGMNFANLFPDLYGLSKHLAVRHEFMIRDVSFRGMLEKFAKFSESA